MDERKQYANKFASGMADIVLSRTMLSREVILIYNEITRDHYQDATISEIGRFKKLAMIKKTLDMHYVQELIGPELLEDSIDQIPWLVHLTTEGLPRIPRMDDQIIIDGLRYTISLVKPMNRDLESLMTLFIYPERVVGEDPLKIHSVKYFHNGEQIESLVDYNGELVLFDVLYGGFPKLLSFDGVNWQDFKSRVIQEATYNMTLYISDGVNKTSYDL